MLECPASCSTGKVSITLIAFLGVAGVKAEAKEVMAEVAAEEVAAATVVTGV